ncbi:TetR/AcrR family transcriptional regulator [Paenibacillus montanisoli]|uniref:TetR/AcrR family transcriptional regulator n=1 Tax=Paenibacillus montanisoli TaxID=2081970 RepID=A0A328TY44_9BACL|nr:TetR/AcrR family transcriptional regulator [Paenibacillus montanisoli]RAP75398.1 TetR/AcrR family transcriptional regulator [Paenibacillus montanisoli]
MAASRSNQSQETRAMIIRTAKEMFMKLGYRAVSTRLIAEACGVTQPALYHHFKDKQALYLDVMRSVCDGTRSALGRMIGSEPDMRGRLYRFTAYMLASHPEDLSRMFHDIRHELAAESQRIIYELWRSAYLVPLIDIFGEGQRSGELRSSAQFGMTPEKSARMLLGMINQSLASAQTAIAGASAPQGGGADAAGENGQKDWEPQAHMLVNVLLYGLSAAPPPSE